MQKILLQFAGRNNFDLLQVKDRNVTIKYCLLLVGKSEKLVSMKGEHWIEFDLKGCEHYLILFSGLGYL